MRRKRNGNHGGLSRSHTAKSFANRAWYYWRRSHWLIDPRSFLSDYGAVRIDRPIFLLGEHGSGTTLAARMMRRHPAIVTISGDHRYWTGADEMQTAMNLVLPDDLVLGGARIRRVHAHPRLTLPHSWAYATDELLPSYRRTEAHCDEKARRQLHRVIRRTLRRHGNGREGRRFLDKSQVFTVKVSFVNALLRDAEPHFVLLTRNPYAACYRAAIGKAGDMRRYAAYMDLDERIRLCAQHWANGVRCALDDGEKVRHFMIVRFEDLLANPEATLRTLCSFLGLSFTDDMLPRPHHELPFGTKYLARWYPLKTDVNEPYLGALPARQIEMIAERCEGLARLLGYPTPAEHAWPEQHHKALAQSPITDTP